MVPYCKRTTLLLIYTCFMGQKLMQSFEEGEGAIFLSLRFFSFLRFVADFDPDFNPPCISKKVIGGMEIGGKIKTCTLEYFLFCEFQKKVGWRRKQKKKK